MIITYLITALSIGFAVSSILYYKKNKRFIGRRASTTIAAVIVGIMGIIASVMQISINELQYIIEHMSK